MARYANNRTVMRATRSVTPRRTSAVRSTMTFCRHGFLPNLGASYVYAPNERWAFTARAGWLSASVDPYDGEIINMSVGVHYTVAKRVGLGLNYNLFRLNAGVKDSGWRGEVDFRYRGPFISIAAYWD